MPIQCYGTIVTKEYRESDNRKKLNSTPFSVGMGKGTQDIGDITI